MDITDLIILQKKIFINVLAFVFVSNSLPVAFAMLAEYFILPIFVSSLGYTNFLNRLFESNKINKIHLFYAQDTIHLVDAILLHTQVQSKKIWFVFDVDEELPPIWSGTDNTLVVCVFNNNNIARTANVHKLYGYSQSDYFILTEYGDGILEYLDKIAKKRKINNVLGWFYRTKNQFHIFTFEPYKPRIPYKVFKETHNGNLYNKIFTDKSVDMSESTIIVSAFLNPPRIIYLSQINDKTENIASIGGNEGFLLDHFESYFNTTMTVHSPKNSAKSLKDDYKNIFKELEKTFKVNSLFPMRINDELVYCENN